MPYAALIGPHLQRPNRKYAKTANQKLDCFEPDSDRQNQSHSWAHSRQWQAF